MICLQYVYILTQRIMTRLSKSFIDKIDPPVYIDGKSTQSFYRDSAIQGFGLRVTSAGTKAFIVEKRINGKVKRITIGKYGQITPEKARIKAVELLGEITIGNDPIADKKSHLSEQVSLSEALTSYLSTRKDLKPSTVHNYTVCIDRYLPDWKNKRLIDIDKDMIETRHAKIGKTTPSKANNTMRVVRAIFNHAIEKYEDSKGKAIFAVNPVSRLSRNRAWYREVKRTGHLKPHELYKWFEATKQLLNASSRDYLQLLLFTGLRKNEAATLRWDNIDFKHRTLTVLDTKNRDPHSLPLSDFLFDLLSVRKTIAPSIWVFEGADNTDHLKEPRSAVNRVAELSNISFTLHDLRRTFITIAESQDIPAYALKKLANHRIAHDITASYIISDVERLRKPMQQVTDFIKLQIQNKEEA
jgi:integrase